MFVALRIKQVNLELSTQVPIEHSEEDEIHSPVESSHSVSFGLKQVNEDEL
jgi:hypothetical protein